MVAWWNLGLPRVVPQAELAPIHARIDALEQINRDSRLLVLASPRQVRLRRILYRVAALADRDQLGIDLPAALNLPGGWHTCGYVVPWF